MTVARLIAEHPGAVQGLSESEIAAALQEAQATIDPPVESELFEGEGVYQAVALEGDPLMLVSVVDAGGEVECQLVGNSVRASQDFDPPIEVSYVSKAGYALYEQQIVAHVRARLRRERA